MNQPSFPRKPWLRLGLAGACTGLLAACASGPMGGTADMPAIELNIAHINDHHSQLEPTNGAELPLDGQVTRVSLGGFARVTSAFKQLEGTPNLLKLHAGDAVTGSLYYTFFKGAADARMMNTVCFDAFALGNHEFDDGDAVLQGFLKELAQGPCQTPVLAANVVPQPGSPLAPAGGPSFLKPYITKSYGGVKVGVVGIDIAGKTVNSSRPLASTRFLNEVETAQKSIDELKRQGVRHIVLLTHQGYENDRAMAAQLTDVDVIIGGDSHSLLGDFKHLGLASSGAYPTVVKNKNGETVCVGQAWEYAKAIGLMNVKFDTQGRVAACGGRASLLIGEPFERKAADGKWVKLDAPAQTALTAALAKDPALKVLAPDAQASAVLAQFSGQVNEQKTKRIGNASAPLCLVRVPGEATNRSGSVGGCEKANTLAQGSDAAQAVAEGFLAASKRAQIALQNAGGVRVAIPAGPITMNNAITVLPFSNVLVEMDLKGQDIVDALEDAVSNHLDKKQSDGSHPYAAGLRWDLDMSQPKGKRFGNLQVRDRATGQFQPLDRARNYVVVTNDFIASGKDGYTALGTAYNAGRFVNTYLLYTQSFADHLQGLGQIAPPKRGDYSHQKVVTATGQTLP